MGLDGADPDVRGRPLDGTLVIDATDAFGAYAGRLLADLGASVVRVVPRDGDPVEREWPLVPTADGHASAFGWFVNLGKSTLALDLMAPDDAEAFQRLIGGADVLLESWGPEPESSGGWSHDQLAARFPELIVVSVTPFGITGPRARDAATDLVALASGGLLSLGGYPDTEPIAAHGQARLGGAIFGAAAAIFGLIARRADGRARHLDVATQEVVAGALEDAIPQFDLTGTVRRRAGDMPREAGTGIYRCADGYVSMVAGRLGTAKAWKALVAWLVEEGVEGAAVLLEPAWDSFPHRQRPASVATFVSVFERFTVGRTKEALYEEAQRRDIALAPVNEVPDVLADVQLAARGFFAAVQPPGLDHPLRVPGRPFRLSGEAPFSPVPSVPLDPNPRTSQAAGPAAARRGANQATATT
jgi:benzylsuccinate CoA-transferase BbsE subunit